MLDYEWGNPSTIMITGAGAGEEPPSQNDPTRNIFDQYSQNCFNETTTPLLHPNDFLHNTHQQHHQHFLQNPTHAHFSSLYDPRAYGGNCGYPPPTSPTPLLSLEPVGGSSGGQGGYMLVPKTEPSGCGIDFTNSRIGLNLGGRTYFSSAEDDFVNRLYRRSRPLEAGLVNSPRCQAEGCNADLTHAKHYHRRHKVCEFHSKASTVITAGLTQRFCQQCSRFHLLSEFDNGKRSCRKRLADHNRRRRKSSQNQASQDHNKALASAAKNSSSENVTRSPPDSGAQSSSSVTLAVSPTRMSLDCFQQRSYQATTSTSSTSNGSIFFSNG